MTEPISPMSFTNPAKRINMKTKPILVLSVLLWIANPTYSQAQTPPEYEPPISEEDKNLASTLFKAAVKDMINEHYEEAYRKLVESRRLNAKPGTLFTLAECEGLLNRLQSAKVHYQEFIHAVGELPEEQQVKYRDRLKNASTAVAKLETQIPKIRFEMPPDWNPNIVVRVDGLVFTSEALHSDYAVDPGQHTVTTQLKDGPIHEEQHTLAQEEVWTLRLRAPPLAPPKILPPPQPAPPALSALPAQRASDAFLIRGTAFTLGGLALASLGIGIASYERKSLDKDTKNFVVGLTTGLSIGLVLGTAAVITLHYSSSSSSSPKSAHIRPQLAASPQGAFVGLNGAF